MAKKNYRIDEETFQQIVKDYYADVSNSTTVLGKKYGYHFASIAKKMRKRGYKLRSNSESQIGVRLGPKHPSFKEYGKSTGYSTYKRVTADIKHCKQCNTTDNLVVHHLDHNHHNNNPANLTKLCRSCHSTYHNNFRWQNGLPIGNKKHVSQNV